MKPLKELYNHKVKHPGSMSFYQVSLVVGANAHNKKEVEEMLKEIAPGLEAYLFERGFMLEIPGGSK